MMDTDDYLLISGIQHFYFCRRKWALIHIEQQWEENVLTIEGQILHETAHSDKTEKRKDMLIVRGMNIMSHELKMRGVCDVVEFHKHPEGISLHGRKGLWKPYPVEYKRGRPNETHSDQYQVCAQAMCLEEMLACKIDEASVYYGEKKRRQVVTLAEALREDLKSKVREMHDFYRKRYTPKVKKKKGCKSCSLMDICLPQLEKTREVANYVNLHLKEG